MNILTKDERKENEQNMLVIKNEISTEFRLTFSSSTK